MPETVKVEGAILKICDRQARAFATFPIDE
jgi:ribosome-binding protein aMBF1 (putative translation factor)